MKQGKRKIKSQEARMLQNLFKIPRSLTVNELANKSNISWQTTDKYLQKWQNKGLVRQVEKKIYSQKLKKMIALLCITWA